MARRRPSTLTVDEGRNCPTVQAVNSIEPVAQRPPEPTEGERGSYPTTTEWGTPFRTDECYHGVVTSIYELDDWHDDDIREDDETDDEDTEMLHGTIPVKRKKAVRDKHGNSRERQAAGVVKLREEAWGCPSKQTMECTRNVVTFLANRVAFERNHYKSHKAYPALNNRRVDSGATADPFKIPTSRQGNEYYHVMMYKKSRLIVGEGILKVDGPTITGSLFRFFRERGIPDELRTDCGMYYKAGECVKALRTLGVRQSFSEPRRQEQNQVEAGAIKRLKVTFKTLQYVAERQGVGILEDEHEDAYDHIIGLLNLLVHKKGGAPALQLHEGVTPDGSAYNQYFFGEIIEVYQESKATDTTSGWVLGRFIGVAPNVGNVMCFTVRLQKRDSNKWNGLVIQTSSTRVRRGEKNPGEKRVLETDSTPPDEHWQTVLDQDQYYDKMDKEDREARRRAIRNQLADARKRKADKGETDDEESDQEHPRKVPRNHSYDEDEGPKEEQEWWEFERFTKNRTVQNGRDIKIWIKWTSMDGKRYQPSPEYMFKGDGLAYQAEENTVLGDDLAKYILEETKGKCKRATDWAKMYIEGRKNDSINPSLPTRKTKQVRRSPYEWKQGFRIPRGLKNALLHDAEMDEDAKLPRPRLAEIVGTRRWRDAIRKEILKFYATNIGTDNEAALKILDKGSEKPKGYQQVRCFWIFDIKGDGTLKARWVAGGDGIDSRGVAKSMTVISSMGMRIMFAQAAKDEQKVLSGDLSNAYLHARTRERVCCLLGDEWGEDKGKYAIIIKAIYGLVSSAYEYHNYVMAAMLEMGWTSSEAQPDIWIRKSGDKYDRIGFYVDDLILTGSDPGDIIEELGEYFTFKFIADPEEYLGAEIKQTETGLALCSRRYILNAIDTIERRRGAGGPASKEEKENWIRQYRYENDKNEKESAQAWNTYMKERMKKVIKMADTPMIPTLQCENLSDGEREFLGEKEKRIYQSHIGMLMWVVQLGRFDVGYAVSTLSGFNSSPQRGHQIAVDRVLGYLKKHTNKPIYVSPEEIEGLPEEYTNEETRLMAERYSYAQEERSEREPVGLTEGCGLSVFCDASHAGEVVGRRSVTGVIGFYGSTPIFWFSRRQSVVAGSTYEAEFIALKLAVDEIRGVRYLLRSMGIRVNQPARLLGDNEGVLQSASRYDAGLKKKHVGIAYHRCREAMACGICTFHKIPSGSNISDLLTKPLDAVVLKRLMEYAKPK